MYMYYKLNIILVKASYFTSLTQAKLIAYGINSLQSGPGNFQPMEAPIFHPYSWYECTIVCIILTSHTFSVTV